MRAQMTRNRGARGAALLALSGLCICVGCAGVRWDTSWPERRALGQSLDTFQPPKRLGQVESAPALKEPTGELSLRDALKLSLLHNPKLAAFSWDVRAHEARTLQAALPPNPDISFRMEDVGGSDEFRHFDSAESTLALGQLVELGGKRTRRHRVADLDEDVAGWDYEAVRIDVFTHTTQAFAAALAAQERLALADELVRIAREALETVDREVEEGLVSPIARTRAKVALAAAEVDREHNKAELLTARSELAASWGSEQEAFLKVHGELEAVVEPPSLERLVARIAHNPDLARWTTEIERRRAVVDLERARRVPDVYVQAGVRRFSTTDDTAVVLGFEIPIPLLDRNQGNVMAAHYELARAEQQHRSARLRALTTLAAADDRLRGAYRQVTALRGEVLPDAEVVFETILEEFDAGNYPYDDVLDAQRTLFRLRSQYLQALEAYHVAVADVERLIGEPLSQVP